MHRCLIALLLFWAVPAPAAHAQDCGDAATQSELNACAGAALKRADGELNTLYGEARRRLKDDAEAGKLLVAAERAWIAFRDAECAFQASASAGGSIYPMLLGQCREALTRKRADDLRAYLACEEGDLSCPIPPQ